MDFLINNITITRAHTNHSYILSHNTEMRTHRARSRSHVNSVWAAG